MGEVFSVWLGIAGGFGFWVWSVTWCEEAGEALDKMLPTTIVVSVVLIHQYFGWGYCMWLGAQLAHTIF
jgi:hypothetical protein